MITWILLAALAIASFIAVLSFLVFFHELGHYSVGRLFGVAVEKFSIGFGRPVVSWKAKSGTQWQISRIPLGGYVKFLGDAGAASNPDQAQLDEIRAKIDMEQGAGVADSCFHFKPLWQRALIVLAGPIANFILAVLIYAGLAWGVGSTDLKAVAGEIKPGQAAEAGGMMVGDEILTMNGKDTSTYSQVMMTVALNAGEPLAVKVLRDGEEKTLMITPRKTEREDAIGGNNNIGFIGMGFDNDPSLITFREYGPIESLGYGVSELGRSLSSTGRYIGRIFTGKEDGKQLGSVVKIAAITGKVAIDSVQTEATPAQRAKLLFYRLISLAAAISIGLGVANLMPIPVLDGGHLVYYGYEAIAGKPLSREKQEFGFRIGVSLLLALFVFLTWNDIGYVRSLFS